MRGLLDKRLLVVTGKGGVGKTTVAAAMGLLAVQATGHALALLSAPRTFGAIARVGPIAAQTRRIEELLGDHARSGYLAVAAGTELAIDETLELKAKLSAQLARQLDVALV